MKALKKQRHYWGTVWMLAKTDLKMRYNGSVLGILWVFLKPFCIFLILNFVFSHVFAGDTPNFSIKLLLALMLWSFFAEGTMQGLTSLVNKAHIIKKIPVPHWAIILASTIHSALAFLFNIIILVIFFWGYHIPLTLMTLVAGIYITLLLYACILAISLITAPLFVKFRDLSQIWEVLLQILFYAAPIIYPLAIIPAVYRTWLYINPIAFLIEHAKLLLIDGVLVRPDHHVIMMLMILLFVLIAAGLGKLFSRHVAEQL